MMNVTFVTGNRRVRCTVHQPQRVHKPVSMGLKGHRSVGGMRASIYNAFPPEGVDALIDFHAGLRSAASAERCEAVTSDTRLTRQVTGGHGRMGRRQSAAVGE